jgi:hypothetical protein
MAGFAEGEALADIDPARAAAALEEALGLAREVGNRFVAGTALTAAYDQARAAGAARSLEEAAENALGLLTPAPGGPAAP